jgi:hypothetical protein
MAEVFEKQTRVRAQRPMVLALGGVVALALFLATLGVLRGADPRAVLAAIAALGGVSLWRLRTPTARPSRIRASRDGLVVGKVLAAPRDAMTSAVLLRDKGELWVRVEGAFAPLDVAVEGEEEGAALLHALEADALSLASRHEVLRAGLFGSLSPRLLLVTSIGIALFGALFHTPWAMMATIGAALAGLALLFHQLRRARLVVGVDGIALQEGWGAPRFVPHEQIEEVKALGDMVTIHLRDGSRVQVAAEDRLPAAGQRTGVKGRPPEPPPMQRSAKAHALAERIEAARAAHRTLAGGAVVPGLARDGRSASEWLAALRRIGEEEAGFRTSAAVRDRLWEILESSTSTPADRVAALTALRAHLGEEDQPRVRVALERVASPDVRERLRVALSADDAALEQVLDEAAPAQVAEETDER